MGPGFLSTPRAPVEEVGLHAILNGLKVKFISSIMKAQKLKEDTNQLRRKGKENFIAKPSYFEPLRFPRLNK